MADYVFRAAKAGVERQCGAVALAFDEVRRHCSFRDALYCTHESVADPREGLTAHGGYCCIRGCPLEIGKDSPALRCGNDEEVE